ncbi:Gfo/Idh/MocA family oxidoreductase [candidate division KSB1 bacterium]|nr:Gfo/Idh/MocA family oxidoreductase [candidate division KSB1 bacterium]
MSLTPANVGIIGCGNISEIYFKNSQKFDILNVAACADLIKEKAKAKAEKYEGVKVRSTKDILDDPAIEIVLNITTPEAHAEISQAALDAGKSVYNEKPLTITRADGRKLLQTAAQKKLRIGCAPDTFLGGSHQTCRKLIDDGWIGEPVGATAFMLCHGHESWHPDPEFYYKKGGGPMFDMGPYYLTALVNLLGPVKRVTGATKTTFPTRLITSEPKYGTVIDVETPTHVVGVMEFANGAVGTIVTSFDVWATRLPCIEIYGTEGSMSVPDPNGFGGSVLVTRGRGGEWKEIPLTHGYADNSRAVGMADLAYGLRTGRPHRASGDLSYHVLDLMHAFHDAADASSYVDLESTCERPAPLPMGLVAWTLDE